MINFLSKVILTFENWFEEDLEDWNFNSPEEFKMFTYNTQISACYHVTEIEDFGGEGMGDVRYCIFKIVDKRTLEEWFVKFEGSYDSWNGSEWDDEPFFVAPVEKTIIVYEKIK